MAQNITLLGASYTGVPAVELPKTGGGTASFTDVTDTTAVASDVAQGKYFYLANGTKVAGTSTGGGGGGYVTQDQDGYIVLPPDGDGGGESITVESLSVTQNGTYTAPSGKAYSPVTVNVSGGGSFEELVMSITKDELLVEDDGLVLPSYSTTAQTVRSYDSTVTIPNIDFDNYDYFSREKCLLYPTYDDLQISLAGKVFLYFFCTEIQYIYLPNDSLEVDGLTPVSNISTSATKQFQRLVYGSSGNLPVYYSTTSEGISATTSTVAYQENTQTLSIAGGKVRMKGSNTYFKQSWFDAVTEIRYQRVMDVYRVPKGSETIGKQIKDILDCYNSGGSL